MGELKRILIVEDSPTVIEMMRLMLKDMNVKIQTAGSEFGMFQAIEAFGKTVDLVIMDITLKSENGLDLIAKIRDNPKYMELPVIVVTEHAQKDFILRAKSLNVKSFIRKPIEKGIFVERLVEAIGIEPLGNTAARTFTPAQAGATSALSDIPDDPELPAQTEAVSSVSLEEPGGADEDSTKAVDNSDKED